MEPLSMQIQSGWGGEGWRTEARPAVVYNTWLYLLLCPAPLSSRLARYRAGAGGREAGLKRPIYHTEDTIIALVYHQRPCFHYFSLMIGSVRLPTPANKAHVPITTLLPANGTPFNVQLEGARYETSALGRDQGSI
ncbi:hypothetical protein DPEC_G00153580 [Dallia pectoralis]|uniref:Uncharacterized protein n=1 Tax=Dallia pectoralis TaxID=75939 RepID=A0ACC2GK93_DALPE|nr:hypothetical protein DPEC_G00153580 [Dallia pectoralis]